MPAIMKPRVIASEAEEQTALFRWAYFNSRIIPELTMLFHVPNGGRRDKITAAHLKAEGVKAGVPDLCLPVARGKWHGLYIELKVGENRPTPAQKEWIENLRRQDYRAEVCYGWVDASAVIMNYLKIK